LVRGAAAVVLIVVLLPGPVLSVALEGCSDPAGRYMTLALHHRGAYPHVSVGADPT
jgi:hypothetical protein